MTEDLFADPKTLSASERLARLNELRHKQMQHKLGKGPELTDEELGYAILLIRVERAGAAEAKGKKPASIVPTELSAF